MTTKHLISILLAFSALACDGEPDEKFRTSGCDVSPAGDIEITYNERLMVLDLETGLELDGEICLAPGARVIESNGAGLGPDAAPWYNPDPQGASFGCSCKDSAGVYWSQQCSDPPYYGCTQCCDGNGGGNTNIKIPPGPIWPPDPN